MNSLKHEDHAKLYTTEQFADELLSTYTTPSSGKIAENNSQNMSMRRGTHSPYVESVTHLGVLMPQRTMYISLPDNLLEVIISGLNWTHFHQPRSVEVIGKEPIENYQR